MLRIDPRLKYLDPKFMDNKLIIDDLEGEEQEIVRVWINEDEYEEVQGVVKSHVIVICPNCEGVGRHLITSLRNIAFSSYDEDYDPEFIENMCQGHYEQPCEVCNGQGRLITLAEYERAY